MKRGEKRGEDAEERRRDRKRTRVNEEMKEREGGGGGEIERERKRKKMSTMTFESWSSLGSSGFSPFGSGIVLPNQVQIHKEVKKRCEKTNRHGEEAEGYDR